MIFMVSQNPIVSRVDINYICNSVFSSLWIRALSFETLLTNLVLSQLSSLNSETSLVFGLRLTLMLSSTNFVTLGCPLQSLF